MPFKEPRAMLLHQPKPAHIIVPSTLTARMASASTITVKREHGRHISGQAPSNYPEFAAHLVKCGFDSISLNPDSFVQTVREVARAEQRYGLSTGSEPGL